jgi:hypothetical protein
LGYAIKCRGFAPSRASQPKFKLCRASDVRDID